MGNYFSAEEHPSVVLCPPLFERDLKGRHRMARSSFDTMFCKPQLQWLFRDYMQGEVRTATSTVIADPMPVIAALGARTIPKIRRFPSEEKAGPTDVEFQCTASGIGSALLRFQKDPIDPSTFLEVMASTQGEALMRACYFEPRTGWGLCGQAPFSRRETHNAQVGIRYSHPDYSFGAIFNPLVDKSQLAWAVGRYDALVFGLQVKGDGVGKVLQQTHSGHPTLPDMQSSLSIAYSPMTAAAGRGSFMVAAELENQQRLVLSFLNHMAVNRQCRNFFEDQHVVGINNYIDIGLQMTVDVEDEKAGSMSTTPDPKSASLRLAAAWQVNKNWLLKARCGTDAVAAAVVLKAWWQPSLTCGLSATYDLATQKPKLGITLVVENHGNIRYEKSSTRESLMGSALNQRHVATPWDIANKEGHGLLVESKDLDNSLLLGQVQPNSANFM